MIGLVKIGLLTFEIFPMLIDYRIMVNREYCINGKSG